MPLHIALYQPEIPPNTGNIARTCVATDVALHLIHPLGFNIDTKTARRAGMDYWEHAIVHEYQSLDELLTKHSNATFYLIETGGSQIHSNADFSNSEEDIFFIFGNESKGLPKDFLTQHKEKILTIPMGSKVRSLNLSNTAAILIYEALRQQNYTNI